MPLVDHSDNTIPPENHGDPNIALQELSDEEDNEPSSQEKPLLYADEESLAAPPPVSKTKRKNLIVLLILAINTISTCCLVVLNKFIFSFPRLQSLQFSFTAWHVFCTFAILFATSHSPLRLFQRIYLDIRQVFPLAVAFAAWIILNNLSLLLNPLGFYQIAKIATTPTVVFLNYLLNGDTVSRTVFAALATICAGAALTCHGSTNTTPLGVIIAIAAFITTAVYQIWIGKKQTDTGCSGAQLLFNQSYLALGLLGVLAPLVEGGSGDARAPMDAKVWIAILLSGATAMVVNLTQFLIIGRTSAVTFNVASHAKTAIILAVGWLLEPGGFGWAEFVGTVMAAGGAVIYSCSSR
ncbi:triose-phosphate transporter family-domain-containing protein [Tricharina praecox]|uniref:triose-phosphate transporter family-domain-containing protein n=1 Tax=Tricharina praecox TaxID=43433 RepID=UPI00222020FB|nr:triose-phosphate transporter family-domain-containing protein [Tricharina praecox]KAI5842795.1 triose-phosphate transporter family-domain-containing protein [Tricharina praecox]